MRMILFESRLAVNDSWTALEHSSSNRVKSNGYKGCPRSEKSGIFQAK